MKRLLPAFPRLYPLLLAPGCLPFYSSEVVPRAFASRPGGLLLWLTSFLLASMPVHRSLGAYAPERFGARGCRRALSLPQGETPLL